jgi:hypothetical protein
MHANLIKWFSAKAILGSFSVCEFCWKTYWRLGIWNRGGAAWTMDMKSGHMGWKWPVEPIPDTPSKKPVGVTGISGEQPHRAALDHIRAQGRSRDMESAEHA